MADPKTQSELNRLYWESDASVSEIADRLDVSRRALYDGIEPRPAGQPCPECGAELGFRNRTALENLEAECPDCGFEGQLDREEAPAGNGSRPERTREPLASRRLPDPGSAPVLGTAFVAGLAVGALVTLFAQRH